MRLPVILILLAASSLSWADVIVLKNGKRIVVDVAREQNGRVQYEVGDNSFAISKTLVDRIETGTGTVVGRSQLTPPSVTPNGTITVPEDLSAKLIHDGKVDIDVLAALDRSDDQQTAAGAYFRAAKFEQEHGSPDKATRYYGLALGHMPNSNVILNHYASLLVRMGRGEEAVSLAERSTRLAPDAGDGWMVLGFAYYAIDRDEDAIQAWKHSEEIHPDPTVKKYLEKTLRDTRAQANFQQRDSGHFTMRYEGHKVSDLLSNAILAELEVHYDALAQQFNVSPRTIPVILYTEQDFVDVTQSPSWTGAVNDGKIRIPVSGLTLMTPELSRILRHELAHTFITQVSRGKCPQWLQEGIAQVLEGRSTAPYGRTLSKLYAEDHEVPMYMLEGSFMNLGKDEAAVAYIQSLAVTEFIRDTYGMDDLQRILERIGDGATTEAAVRTTLHTGYSQLEKDVALYLANRYGT